MNPTRSRQEPGDVAHDRFVGQPLRPEAATANAAAMASGAPGLPRRFRWGQAVLEIAAVRRAWTETGACRHGSGEAYVRKHWFDAVTPGGAGVRIYFERQARSRRDARRRWWLYSIREPETDHD